MKILAVSGGTKNGNNDAMAREALMGVKEVCPDAEIEFIRLLDCELKPCTGCIACTMKIMQGKESTCVVQGDDFLWLRDKLLDADGVIFTIPIFEKRAMGHFMTLQDRFAGPAHDRGMNTLCKIMAEKTGNEGPDMRLFRDDKFVSFIAIGGSDWATRIAADFANFAMVPKWNILHNETFIWSKGIATEDEKVAKCHEIGVEMAKACMDPTTYKYHSEDGICPHCHSRNFFMTNDATKTICCVCGIEGELKIVDGKAQFTFTEEAETHAHDLLSGKMMHAEDIGRNEGALIEAKKGDKYKNRMESYKNFISPTMPPR